MYLYTDINLRNFESLLHTSITHLINKEPIFALVWKTIFDGVINDLVFTTKIARSFTKKSDQKPLVIHLKVCKEQAYRVTSVVRKIIVSPKF